MSSTAILNEAREETRRRIERFEAELKARRADGDTTAYVYEDHREIADEVRREFKLEETVALSDLL